MVKKCLVKYDELGKPIELVELKEFTDPKVLKEFKEKCELNKAQYLLRLEELLGIKITIISVGPDREQTIFV